MDFSSESVCKQMVHGPTHVHGVALDLLFIDVHELVSVVAPIGSSDHSTLYISLDIGQRIPEFVIRREVFMKSRANWDN